MIILLKNTKGNISFNLMFKIRKKCKYDYNVCKSAKCFFKTIDFVSKFMDHMKQRTTLWYGMFR